MRVFRIIRKSFSDAFKSIFRNFSLSLASISCTAITLILVAIAILVTYNVNTITKNIEDVLTIVVFVDSNATDDDIKNIEAKIDEIKNVESYEFSSKEQIKDELKEDEDLGKILDVLGENVNPLQSTFVLSVKDVRKISNTADTVKQIDNVTSVKYGESMVNKLVSAFDMAKNACIVAVVALIVVTAFLISNTIKITIFSRRQEISIMRLVGTSNTVIKMPFLIEGFVLGVIGSIIPILVTIFGYTLFYDSVGGKLFSDLLLLEDPSTIIYTTSFVVVVVGAVVGMFGSVRAVRKYLKV